VIARSRLIASWFCVLTLVAACASPAPTASPAIPSPVQASPNPGLVEFETHMQDAVKSQGSLVRDLASATTGSNQQLRVVALKLESWAADELIWLTAHPADDCYENAWLTYKSGVDDVATAAGAFEALAGRASPPSDTEGQEAAVSLATGTSSLDAAADLANQARAACR